MMEKAKRQYKQQNRRLWDSLLFTKTIYIETFLTPGECFEQLRTLPYKRRGFFKSSSCSLQVWSLDRTVSSLDFGVFEFDLNTKNHRCASTITHAKVTGFIQWHPHRGMTLIQAEIKLGAWVVILLPLSIVWLILIVGFFIPIGELSGITVLTLSVPFAAIIAISFALQLWQPLSHYQTLYADVHRVLEVEIPNAKAKKKTQAV